MSENLENQSLNTEPVFNQESASVCLNENIDSESLVSDENVEELPHNQSNNDIENVEKENGLDNDYDSLTEVIKKIAEAKEKLNKELDSKKQYLSENLSKYDSENYFQNESFKNLYSEAFNALGTNLDTDKFVSLLDNYVESRINLHSKKLASEKENDNATDSMKFDSGISKSPDKKPKMQDIPENELEKYIAKYV